jgi:hypothetical protein
MLSAKSFLVDSENDSCGRLALYSLTLAMSLLHVFQSIDQGSELPRIPKFYCNGFECSNRSDVFIHGLWYLIGTGT